MHRYIKAVGAGAKRARALSREEARAAMALVAGGGAEPVQVGAFLLALRMKGETPEELAGFADALAAHVAPEAAPPAGTLEVDAHGDGHGDRPSLLLAAAFAVAATGVPVCLSLQRDSPYARHGLDGALVAFGFHGALTPARAAADLAHTGVAAVDLALACPPLARLVALRPLLGLRSAAQTLAKLVSPFRPAKAIDQGEPNPRRIVGVFHAPYLEATAAALGRLGVVGGLVVQALGGLPEARPGKVMRVADAGDGPTRSIDLRAFPDEPDEPDADLPITGKGASDTTTTTKRRIDAAPITRAALDGKAPHARRAAAAAAVLLHVATGADPRAAAEAALAALTSGRARAIADRLRR